MIAPAQQPGSVHWVTALALTATFMTASFLTGSPAALAALYLAAVMMSMLATRSFARTLIAIRLSLLFIVPVIAIHGLLNPEFSVTGQWLGLNVRKSGLTFGAIIGLRVSVAIAVSLVWLSVSIERTVADMTALGMPLPLILVLAQSISLARSLQRRVAVVYLAQQARGVPVSGGLLRRLASLSKVAIPLFVSVIAEAAARAEILTSRGMGVGPLSEGTTFRVPATAIACLVMAMTASTAIILWL